MEEISEIIHIELSKLVSSYVHTTITSLHDMCFFTLLLSYISIISKNRDRHYILQVYILFLYLLVTVEKHEKYS